MASIVNAEAGAAVDHHDGSGSNSKGLEGAEVVYGTEACYEHCVNLLQELGFPKGVMPLRKLDECGGLRETGYVWMKQREPYEHYFKGTNTRVSYAREVTAVVEKGRMKKMTGVKTRQMLLWVPLTEMSLVDGGKKIFFKTPLGVGRSFPISAFEEEEEDKGAEGRGKKEEGIVEELKVEAVAS